MQRVAWRVLAVLACVSAAAGITGGGSVPAGLPSSFAFGAAVKPCYEDWVLGGQVAMQYYYMEFGGPFGNDWTDYWDGKLPETFFGLAARMYGNPVPVVVYRQLADNGQAATAGLDAIQDAGRAAKYWANWDELMRRVNDFGRAVIVIVEPDLWGLAQRTGSSPSLIDAVVQSTTYTPVAGTNRPDTLAGFAQALRDRRDTLARNARLAVMFDHGATGVDLFGDVSQATLSALLQRADTTATWISALGANWDLFVASPMDTETRRVADADWAVLNEGDYHLWWDPVDSGNYANIAPSVRSFLRTRRILQQFSTSAGLRGLLWRVPVGNTYYSECNNDPGHYRDNKIEYFLPPGIPIGESESVPGGGDTSHLAWWWDAGVLGAMFGAGELGYQCTQTSHAQQKSVTSPRDFLNCPAASDCDSDMPSTNKDGIRHPEFDTPGNSAHGWSNWGVHKAVYADNDGGYTRIALRVFAGLSPYYTPPVTPLWYETLHGRIVLALSALIVFLCIGSWLKGLCCRRKNRGWSHKAQEPGNRDGARIRRQRDAAATQQQHQRQVNLARAEASRGHTPAGLHRSTSQTPLKTDEAGTGFREAWVETEDVVTTTPPRTWRDRAQYVVTEPGDDGAVNDEAVASPRTPSGLPSRRV